VPARGRRKFTKIESNNSEKSSNKFTGHGIIGKHHPQAIKLYS
jgi:hypothetical protein